MQPTPAPARTEPSAPANTPRGADHAIDKLRAAQLRRQLAAEGSSVFVHAPRPALVPQEPNHYWQRRFGAGDMPSDYIQPATECEAALLIAQFEVFRDGEYDLAEVRARLGIRTTAEVTIRLPPAELRDLAARLIDAAHDIEAHPSATLAPEREAA